jgi:hypothetical protein
VHRVDILSENRHLPATRGRAQRPTMVEISLRRHEAVMRQWLEEDALPVRARYVVMMGAAVGILLAAIATGLLMR